MSIPSFGVRRPVVANLVMFAIVGAGLIFGVGLRREFFPEIRPNQVLITAPYPGASPDEVEDALAIKIEDQIADLTDIKEITTTVREGLATVIVEYEDGSDIDDAVAEIKRSVDALQDLPEAAERITVTDLEPSLPVIVVSLFGDSSERALKDAMREIRDDLRSLPGMGNIAVDGTRADEITVEVRPEAMIEHGLSLPAIADRVRAAMVELPGGTVRTATSNISIRSVGAEEDAEAVRNIVVRSAGAGQVLRLSDIAEVSSGFADTPLITRLNGKPAVNATVFKKGNEDIVKMAEMVKAYVAGRRGESIDLTIGEKVSGLLSPPDSTEPSSDRLKAYELGLSKADIALPGEITTTTDLARFVVGRLDLLTRNAFWGGVLVFLTLVLLLNWRVSFWVAAGLVISLLGTLAVMNFVGMSLNLLTMFGLIVVIGILVDDAIVVAENITTRHEAGEPALSAAISGTHQVGWPVVATVLTTICAFLPLGLVEGTIGDMLAALPIVVACALLVSLIESLFILPSHMGHSLKGADRRTAEHRESWFGRLEHRLDRARDAFFARIVVRAYMKTLDICLRAKYATTMVAIALVIGSLGLVAGGRLEFIFLETEDAETVNIELRMPVGTPLELTSSYAARLEAAVAQQPEVDSFYAAVGAISSLDGGGTPSVSTDTAQLILELKPVEFRDRTSDQVIQSIRDATGQMTGIKSLRMQGISGGPEGPAISLTMVGEDQDQIERASEALMLRLAEFDGVVDIAADTESGQREVRFELRDGASELGFTRSSLGRQIQGFVFGIEAFTFAGVREDVDVRVMLPEALRRDLGSLEQQYVFTPDGRAVPLPEVARIEEGEGYTTVRRLDRQRAVTVLADVDRARANPEEVMAALGPFLAEIPREFPGVAVRLEGRQQDVAESFASLPIGFLTAAGLIYVILAWLFSSYTQPLVVMAAIPFATIGMIWGHVFVGYVTLGHPYSLTFLSLIGFVALAGIVVNDSLIFMEFFNEKRREGASVQDAVILAGKARVRAILLTTITTALGLLPLMLEQSFQARFLIPMAITIAFGLISATAIILIVLPCLLLILQDIKHVLTIVWTGRMPTAQDDVFEDPAAEYESGPAGEPASSS